MSKQRPNGNGLTESDINKMKLDYFQPTASLRDIAKKYKLSLNAVYHLCKKHSWSKEKKEVNEIAYLDAVAAYIKKRKNFLLSDLDKIDGIEDKVFKRLKNISPADIRVPDLIALIKCKHDLILKHGTNKAIVENNIQEGDTNIQLNLSEAKLDEKILNITKDLQNNNRVKALNAKPVKK